MANETSTRQWWMIIRRDGYEVARTQLRMPRTQTQRDLDPLVDPIPANDDADLLDDNTILPSDDQDKAYSYEIVAVTAPFEINEVD